MKPYPKYKESGIEWIGQIPANWEIKRLKYCVPEKKFAIVDGPFGTQLKAEEYQDEGIPLIRITNLSFDGKFLEDGLVFIKEKKAYELLRSSITKNDIIIAKTGATIGKSALNTKIEFGIIASSCLKVSPNLNILSPNLLKYFICSDNFQSVILETSSGSTRDTINIQPMANLNIVFSRLTEQRAIADFLDEKTALIDELIDKKTRQIELLKEQRTAIINKAVTKGLDPNVKMKDSGIEWLGEIPEHWEILKMKWVVSKIGSGVTPRGGAEVYQDSGIPLIRSQNVHFDGLRLDDVAYISGYIHKSMERSAIKKGDVLLNITGASIGRCTYVSAGLGEANVNQHVCILRPNATIETKFLHLFLASYLGQDQVLNSQMGTSREGLNYEQLGNFIVILPSVSEQAEIVKDVETQIKQFYSSIAKCEKQIQLLQEYRTALISEAVTGKIDVRMEG
jgi:type I restriction enzyme S subunit